MGGASSSAKKGNAIAAASLAEQQKQYNEQRAREKAKEKAAQSNAASVRTSTRKSYANTFNQATDFGVDESGGYSLLTAGGTPSIINGMLSDNTYASKDTLG